MFGLCGRYGECFMSNALFDSELGVSEHGEGRCIWQPGIALQYQRSWCIASVLLVDAF